MTPEMEKRYRAFCEKHQLYYDDGNRNIGWSELSAAFVEGADCGAAHEREECAKTLEPCGVYRHAVRLIRARGK